ncbi:MAG: cysteine desulfurase-like protein [Pseudomonadota bacterium]
MTVDIGAIRAQFPSLSIKDDGRRRIYLDNPAGTQIPQRVADAVADAMLYRCANQKGPFRTSKLVDRLIDDARLAVADLLNAPSPDEIIFGQSMTALAYHVARAMGNTLTAGDEIIVTTMDHDANVHPWVTMAKEHGLTVRWLSFNTETYEFDSDDLASLLTDRTRLVCIGGAANLTGTLNDVTTLCSLAREAGAWTFIDGVQSVPHVPTDVQAIGCDLLACSGYKFMGPHQGVLWGRREILEQLQAYQLRPAPQAIPGNFETGTPSFELMAGTTAAVDYYDWIGDTMAADFLSQFDAFDGRRQRVHAALAALFDYEKHIASRLVSGLQSLPRVTVRGVTQSERMDHRVPTVAFTHGSKSPATIAEALAADNIFVWNGHNYALELVKAIGCEDGGVVRVGPVHYNTVDEIDDFLNSLDNVLA